MYETPKIAFYECRQQQTMHSGLLWQSLHVQEDGHRQLAGDQSK